MREESHLNEMRSAIRGDFERLAERRGEQELMRVAEDEPSPVAGEVPSDAPVPFPAPLPPPVLVEAEPEPAPEPGVDEDETPHRSWVARFFSP